MMKYVCIAVLCAAMMLSAMQSHAIADTPSEEKPLLFFVPEQLIDDFYQSWVTVEIKGVKNLAAVSCAIVYDPEYFRIVGVRPGGFLGEVQSGNIVRITLKKSSFIAALERNGEKFGFPGKHIIFLHYAQPEENKGGIDGSGVLAAFKVVVRKIGKTQLEFVRVQLFRPDKSLMDFTAENTSINVWLAESEKRP